MCSNKKAASKAVEVLTWAGVGYSEHAKPQGYIGAPAASFQVNTELDEETLSKLRNIPGVRVEE